MCCGFENYRIWPSPKLRGRITKNFDNTPNLNDFRPASAFFHLAQKKVASGLTSPSSSSSQAYRPITLAGTVVAVHAPLSPNRDHSANPQPRAGQFAEGESERQTATSSVRL